MEVLHKEKFEVMEIGVLFCECWNKDDDDDKDDDDVDDDDDDDDLQPTNKDVSIQRLQ